MMSAKNRIGLFLTGFGVWAAATVLFHVTGSYFFERSAVEYWFNAIASGVLCVVVSIGLMKAWQIDQKEWLQGAVCLALPAMLGEIPILYNFSGLMNNMQPETAGRYAASLFVVYASVIGFAWWMSIKTNSQLISGK